MAAHFMVNKNQSLYSGYKAKYKPTHSDCLPLSSNLLEMFMLAFKIPLGLRHSSVTQLAQGPGFNLPHHATLPCFFGINFLWVLIFNNNKEGSGFCQRKTEPDIGVIKVNFVKKFAVEQETSVWNWAQKQIWGRHLGIYN